MISSTRSASLRNNSMKYSVIHNKTFVVGLRLKPSFNISMT